MRCEGGIGVQTNAVLLEQRNQGASLRNRSGAWKRAISVIKEASGWLWKCNRDVSGSQDQGKASKAKESRYEDTKMARLGDVMACLEVGA